MTSSVRRRILAGALLALTHGLPFSRAFGLAPQDLAQPPNVSSDDFLARIWLGKRYLELHPEERSANRIAYILFGDELVSVRDLIGCTDRRQFVLQRHEDDFRDGNVVVIDGWVLTRTEARVFALSAIESAS
jgi:hypothetical protein